MSLVYSGDALIPTARTAQPATYANREKREQRFSFGTQFMSSRKYPLFARLVIGA